MEKSENENERTADSAAHVQFEKRAAQRSKQAGAERQRKRMTTTTDDCHQYISSKARARWRTREGGAQGHKEGTRGTRAGGATTATEAEVADDDDDDGYDLTNER